MGNCNQFRQYALLIDHTLFMHAFGDLSLELYLSARFRLARGAMSAKRTIPFTSHGPELPLSSYTRRRVVNSTKTNLPLKNSNCAYSYLLPRYSPHEHHKYGLASRHKNSP